LRAWKLRTPDQGSGVRPLAWSISHENASGSDFMSQRPELGGGALALWTFFVIDRQWARRHEACNVMILAVGTSPSSDSCIGAGLGIAADR
jgi:hypothetical protein